MFFFILSHHYKPKKKIMKKIYMLITLLLVSGVIFAQVQRADGNRLPATNTIKGIYDLPASNAKAIVDTLHYDFYPYGGVGVGTGTFGIYAFFPASVLTPHNALGNTITHILIAIDSVTTTTIKIMDATHTTLLYSQAFTPVLGWNDVTLTTAFPIPAAGLYIGCEIVCAGGYPALHDSIPAASVNTNGNWVNLGTNWANLSTYSIGGHWNIRALVDGTALTNPTASCTPLTYDFGTIETSSTVVSQDFTLTNTGGGALTCSGITGLSAPITTSLVPASVNLAGGASTTFTFTYHPTADGATNQTAVIATNAGNISIPLTGNAVTCSTISTFPWTESFEGSSFPPVCWAVESPDGGTGWDLIASGTTPLPGWTGGTMTTPTGGGNNAAYCTWNTGGAASNDQWLITPQIAVPANKALSFYLFWNGGYMDNVDVKVSTTTNASTSFTTTLLATDTTQYTTNDWTLFTVPLTAYASQNIYLAFNEHVADNTNDGAFIGIDLVKIDNSTGIAETKEDLVSIFPNPANDKLYIAAGSIKSVEIFNMIGENVASYGNLNVINTSDLSIGAYIVKVVTNSKVVTKKISIVR